MATRVEADVAVDQAPLVLCRWCGQRTPPSPACEECGSPLDRRLRLDLAPALSEDLLERQLHSRSAPTADGDVDGSGPVGAVAPSELVADLAPASDESPAAILVEEHAVVPDEPVVLGGPTWEVGPLPAVRALARKETVTRWGIRVGGFFGLVVLLDFVLTHL